MARFVIMGQVHNHKLYLSYEGASSTTWVESLAKARLFNSQNSAESALKEIAHESEGFHVLGESHYLAPRTLRLLARMAQVDVADVKLSVVAISAVVLSTERWHVENGKGRTKRLS